MFIIRLSENRYYYGNGKNINSIGSSANQFLRFNPYFDYVADKGVQPSEAVKKWLKENEGSE